MKNAIEPSTQDKITTCIRHLDLLIQNRGTRIGTNLMRKHFGWYIKGFPGASTLRQNLVTSNNYTTMVELLNEVSKPAE
jgi:tRNA-dihydrouridine synthase B